MSRYWVFQNNQVVGPHGVEEMPQLPGFGPDSLVCPEGRKGTNMGDWQRASMIAELSVALSKASQLAVAGKGSGSLGSLPPEPTLKDLAHLGSLQEKVSALDSTVNQLQDNLRLKESEILSLHKELDDKTTQAQELAVKLGSFEERLAAVGSLQQNLDRAVAAEQDVETTVQKQAKVIEDLTREIDGLKAEQREIEKLKNDLDELRRAPAPQPAAAPAPAPLAPETTGPTLAEPSASSPDGPASLEPLAPPTPAPALGGDGERPDLGATISLEPPSPAPAFGGDRERPVEKPDLLFKPEPLAAFSQAPKNEPPMPALADLSSAPGVELGMPASGPVQTLSAIPFGTAASPPPVVTPPPPAGTDLAPKPKKKGGKTLVLAAVALLAAGAGAFKLGLIPMGGQKAAPPALPPVPAEPPAPKVPTAEEQAEAARQSAIDLVRRFPTPKGKTIAETLEAGLNLQGALSPWMADKMDDNSFQVNFFSSKPAGGNGQMYQFQASMTDGKVVGANPLAKALLATAPRAPRRKARKAPVVAQAPARKRLARRVPKAEAATLDDLLQTGDQGAKKDESLDQMLLPGTQPAGGQPAADAAEPAPGPSAAAGPKGDATDAPPPANSGKGSDSDLLDTMLKP